MHVQCPFDRSRDNMSLDFKPILVAFAFLFRAFQIGNEWVLSVFSKMNVKFYHTFSLWCISWHGSIRLILFVCKFDHRFLLSDIYFEVVLLLCDSNLYNANEYFWVKVYCARWDYIFDTNWTNNEKSNLIWPKCLSNLSLYCLFFYVFFFFFFKDIA